MSEVPPLWWNERINIRSTNRVRRALFSSHQHRHQRRVDSNGHCGKGKEFEKQRPENSEEVRKYGQIPNRNLIQLLTERSQILLIVSTTHGMRMRNRMKNKNNWEEPNLYAFCAASVCRSNSRTRREMKEKCSWLGGRCLSAYHNSTLNCSRYTQTQVLAREFAWNTVGDKAIHHLPKN